MAFRSLGSYDGSCTCMGPSVGDPPLPDGESCSQDGEAGACAWGGLCLEGAAERMFDDPFPLNTNAGSHAGNDRQPQVTTDGQGTWVAVWNAADPLGDYLGGSIGTDSDILVAVPEPGILLQQLSGIACLLLLRRLRAGSWRSLLKRDYTLRVSSVARY